MALLWIIGGLIGRCRRKKHQMPAAKPGDWNVSHPILLIHPELLQASIGSTGHSEDERGQQ